MEGVSEMRGAKELHAAVGSRKSHEILQRENGVDFAVLHTERPCKCFVFSNSLGRQRRHADQLWVSKYKMNLSALEFLKKDMGKEKVCISYKMGWVRQKELVIT